ncbi:MAG: helix-turn-helix domain-containing protein [Flavobacterium sp.]
MSQENHHFFNQLITKSDLVEFRQNLLSELKQILSGSQPATQWLKSGEVRQILKISSGTLQTLRINGTLNYSKVGSTYFYKYEDIQKMLNQ